MTIRRQKNIALIAHDQKKRELIQADSSLAATTSFVRHRMADEVFTMGTW